METEEGNEARDRRIEREQEKGKAAEGAKGSYRKEWLM
jgi:hypothetical protein